MPALLIVLAPAILAPAVSVAQETDGDPKAEAEPVKREDRSDPDDATKPTKPPADEPVDAAALPDAKGELVPVPRGATLEEYLRFVERRRAEGVRRASVVRVRLVGSSDEKVASLAATLQVKVTDDGWVRVPLALNEGVLRDFEHRAPADPPQGEEEPDAVFDGFTTEDGYAWRFKGRGVHELELDLEVPIRLQSPSRRLQLRLPPTAVSSAELSVDHGSLTVSAPQDSQWSVESEGQRSTIEVIGLGERFTLGWEPRPAPRAAGQSLQVTTAIDVRPNDRTVVVEATQFVQVLRGTVESLRVRLPLGFEARDVAVRLGDGATRGDRLRLEIPEPDGPWTTISLPSSVAERGQVELEWTLESSMPWSDGKLRLNGFDVSGSRSQSGEIALHPLAGHDVGLGTVRNVYRIDVAELTRATGAVGAYRFLRQPFDAELRIAEVEPHFTSRPELRLHVTRDDMRLVGEVRVKVYRGALRQVELVWPDHAEEGWVISPPNVPGLVEQYEILGTGAETRIRFELLEPTSGEFSLPIRALRRIEASPEPMSVHVPSMPASYQLPSLLHVSRAVDLELSLVPNDTTTVHEAAVRDAAGTDPAEAEGIDEGLAVESLRIDPGGYAFGLTVEPRDPLTTVNDTVELSMATSGFHVEQRMEFDVRYAYVRRLRFDRAEGCRFSLGDRALVPTSVDAGDGESQVEVAFDEPLTGRFVVTVETDQRPPGLGENLPSDHALALCSPVSADSLRRVVVAGPSGGYVLEVDDPNWTSTLRTDGGPAWVSTEDPGSVEVVVDRVESRATGRATVRRTLVRTAVGLNGLATTWARYDVASAANPLVLRLPSDTAPDEIRWNGRLLANGEVVESPRGSGRFTLDIGRGSAGDGLLLVRYHTEFASPLGWSDTVAAGAPELVGATWTREAVWELGLPTAHYLLVPPEGVAANYDWQRDPVFWKRVTREGYRDSVRWIDDRASRDESLAFEGRNVYQFLALGPVASLSIRTANRSCLVLFGAGLALALGFVLLRVPALRHVLVLLGLAFVLAVLSLWYVEPVLLLLQPALLGLALAVGAAFIDSAVNRRAPAPPVLSFPTVSSVAGPPAGEASTRTNVVLGVREEAPAGGSSSYAVREDAS